MCVCVCAEAGPFGRDCAKFQWQPPRVRQLEQVGNNRQCTGQPRHKAAVGELALVLFEKNIMLTCN